MYLSVAAATARSKASYQLATTAGDYNAVWNWTGGSSNGFALSDAYKVAPAAASALHLFNAPSSRGFGYGIRG